MPNKPYSTQTPLAGSSLHTAIILEDSEEDRPPPLTSNPRKRRKLPAQHEHSLAPNLRTRRTPDNHVLKSVKSPSGSAQVADSPVSQNATSSTMRGVSQMEEENPFDTHEKRLKRFRPVAPATYRQIYERATTQRMIVLSRKREGGLSETLGICGTTGNLYTVTISHLPSCDCPHALKGNQCKHIVYAMVNVLKAPSHLVYQLALLTTELVEIFDKAPPLPETVAAEQDKDGKRKPIEDDCPICCMEFDEKEEIVYCQAACGNNIHSSCFEQWAASKRKDGAQVTCPFCRSVWQADLSKTVENLSGGQVGDDGYINYAQELGLSTERDYSTYHQVWARGQARGSERRHARRGWNPRLYDDF